MKIRIELHYIAAIDFNAKREQLFQLEVDGLECRDPVELAARIDQLSEQAIAGMAEALKVGSKET